MSRGRIFGRSYTWRCENCRFRVTANGGRTVEACEQISLQHELETGHAVRRVGGGRVEVAA